MSDIIERLYRERACIERMVDVLDEELDLLRDPAKDPDYRLMREIMRYFGHYPTSVHYPFVNAVFDHLAGQDEALSPRIEEMKRRHARQAGLVENLYGLLDGVCSGHMIPRDKLLKEASAYVTLQREHMAPVDEELYGIATRRLTREDLTEIERRCNELTDPQLRATIEDEFTRMRESIEADHYASP